MIPSREKITACDGHRREKRSQLVAVLEGKGERERVVRGGGEREGSRRRRRERRVSGICMGGKRNRKKKIGVKLEIQIGKSN